MAGEAAILDVVASHEWPSMTRTIRGTGDCLFWHGNNMNSEVSRGDVQRGQQSAPVLDRESALADGRSRRLSRRPVIRS